MKNRILTLALAVVLGLMLSLIHILLTSEHLPWTTSSWLIGRIKFSEKA